MKYSVKAAARATGITESRLRTWERRYGIPRPDRSDTGRRQYGDDDIAVIRRMAALVEAGMSASDAADAARHSPAGEEQVPEVRPTDPPLVTAMVQAARAFDEVSLLMALHQSHEALGWGAALEDIILPAMKRIGYAWMVASVSVAMEHFGSQLVRRELGVAMSALPVPAGDGPVIVLACPEAEEHELALLALAYLLRQGGQRLIYLGADVPAVDLLSAVEATHAQAVCLSATTASGYASLVRTARSILIARGPRVFIGGPAVAELDLAPGVRLPASLTDAAALIIRSLGD